MTKHTSHLAYCVAMHFGGAAPIEHHAFDELLLISAALASVHQAAMLLSKLDGYRADVLGPFERTIRSRARHADRSDGDAGDLLGAADNIGDHVAAIRRARRRSAAGVVSDAPPAVSFSDGTDGAIRRSHNPAACCASGSADQASCSSAIFDSTSAPFGAGAKKIKNGPQGQGERKKGKKCAGRLMEGGSPTDLRRPESYICFSFTTPSRPAPR